MLKLLAFVSVFVPLIFADCPVGTIQYPFVPPSKCYSFIPTKATFSSAEAACNKAGGSLTSIHDAFTNSFLKEEASLIFRDSATSDFWIGASRSSNGSSWSWTDKSTFDFTDWKKGATNSGNNYGTMETVSGMWNAADANLQKPFVCATKDNSPIPSTTTTIKPTSSCPEGWYLYDKTNACYFASDAYTWEKGEEYCVSQGGHLASLHDRDELNFGLSVFNGVMWIGLYTNDTTITRYTTWKWTDASQVDFLPWAYPYFSTYIPLCIQLTGTAQYQMFDNANCTNKYYGLCKKPAATAPPPTSPIPTTPQSDLPCLSGWTYLEKTNSCYIHGLDYVHWPEAEKDCVYLDAHLASIHSIEEYNVVSNAGYGYGWIGLYSDNNELTWKWVDDTPFDYRHWALNNPIRGANPCGYIDNSGIRNDQNCFTSTYSICKRAAFKK